MRRFLIVEKVRFGIFWKVQSGKGGLPGRILSSKEEKRRGEWGGGSDTWKRWRARLRIRRSRKRLLLRALGIFSLFLTERDHLEVWKSLLLGLETEDLVLQISSKHSTDHSVSGHMSTVCRIYIYIYIHGNK